MELVDQFKDLGIHFDPKLNCSPHTEMIKKNKHRVTLSLLNVLVVHYQILVP